jgi:ribosomal protein S18 acetylase RimI-like enzyme
VIASVVKSPELFKQQGPESGVSMNVKLVRKLTVEDIPDVVRLHQLAFKGFFLDQMGAGFLTGYYRSVLSYQRSIALVYEAQNSEILGFAVGFYDAAAFYSHFKKQRMRLLPAILFAVVKKPTLISKIIGNMRRVNSPREHAGTAVELSSIATIKLGAGIGAALLEAFKHSAFEIGATEINLTTDEVNNESVKAFYVRHGFFAGELEDRNKRLLRHYFFKK